MAKESTLG
jgi:hypothetical protein